jgi:hypothetical protein
MINVQQQMVTFLLGLDFDINAEVETPFAANHMHGDVRRIRSRPLLLTALMSAPAQYVPQIINHVKFIPRAPVIRRALFHAVRMDNWPAFQSLIPLGNFAMCNGKGESLFVYACLRRASQILPGLETVPGFAVTPREISQGLAFQIFSPGDTMLPILAPFNPNWNEKLPIGINGRRREHLLWIGDYEDIDPEDRPYDNVRAPDLPIEIPPLLAAVRLQRIDVLQALLEFPAVDFNARNEFEQTLLFGLSGNVEGFSLILQRGFDVDAQDLEGNTALMHAIRRRQVQLVYVLIDMGVDLEIRNCSGVLFHFI